MFSETFRLQLLLLSLALLSVFFFLRQLILRGCLDVKKRTFGETQTSPTVTVADLARVWGRGVRTPWHHPCKFGKFQVLTGT